MTTSPHALIGEDGVAFHVKYAHLRRVVCAANLMKDGTLILGPRHWDPTMRRAFKAIYGESAGMLEHEKDQGFVDQWGTYMTRREAKLVAIAQGQLIARHGDSDELFSEDIY